MKAKHKQKWTDTLAVNLKKSGFNPGHSEIRRATEQYLNCGRRITYLKYTVKDAKERGYGRQDVSGIT